jgi:ubiquinone/menaquinone biosynthesis C-methylase UbiE
MTELSTQQSAQTAAVQNQTTDQNQATYQNQVTYQTGDVVRHYTQLQRLQPGEAVILDELRSAIGDAQLKQWSMLDIGVGAGRTSKHFAPLMGQYWGVDYSAEMVAAAQQRFPQWADDDAIRFTVGDARDLADVPNDSQDLVLFSFNGIDSVSESDRSKVFDAVVRVARSGAYFGFSSHNLTAFERTLEVRRHLSWNPITTYVDLVMLGIVRALNFSLDRQKLSDRGHTFIRDESHNFRLKQYYIRPEAQIDQLADRFTNVRVFSWKTGVELVTPEQREACEDLWLYYFCQVR